ncbi:peptidoglycan DD-metalloendopeptidase family protein [Streptomyces sp. NPDC127084]|uniref:M23 family metallopeptidase n=1 Tax=Streptomyces sp. NPDC127084 TaxID=3347133 RepID=UPI00365D40CE
MGHHHGDRCRLLEHGLVQGLVVLACLVLLLPALPAAASDGPTVSAQVARLYEEASEAAASYEQGRREADAERAHTEELEERLWQARGELGRLHDRIGGVARAQYRSGGSLAVTAKLLLADDPEEMIRGWQLAWRMELTVNRLLDDARQAERRSAEAEQRAQEALAVLDAQAARLAEIKKKIETKLQAAQWLLQDKANRSAAAGQCAGAVRLDQSEQPDGSQWVAPVRNYSLSAGFDSAGERWAKRHTGQDFAVGIGTPVRAVGDGRVVSVSCGGGFGIEIVIQHEDGWYTQYAHLAAVTVDQGEWVSAGQWIAQAGTTGNSTGPHLHFEARVTPYLGSGVDPVGWLADRGVFV